MVLCKHLQMGTRSIHASEQSLRKQAVGRLEKET